MSKVTRYSGVAVPRASFDRLENFCSEIGWDKASALTLAIDLFLETIGDTDGRPDPVKCVAIRKTYKSKEAV